MLGEIKGDWKVTDMSGGSGVRATGAKCRLSFKGTANGAFGE